MPWREWGERGKKSCSEWKKPTTKNNTTTTHTKNELPMNFVGLRKLKIVWDGVILGCREQWLEMKMESFNFHYALRRKERLISFQLVIFQFMCIQNLQKTWFLHWKCWKQLVLHYIQFLEKLWLGVSNDMEGWHDNSPCGEDWGASEGQLTKVCTLESSREIWILSMTKLHPRSTKSEFLWVQLRHQCVWSSIDSNV